MSAGTALPARGPAPENGRVGRVLIVSGSVGAGHDGAARELAARLERAGVAADVRDLLEAVPAWAAWVLREGYLATSRRAPSAFEAMFRHAEHGGLSLQAFCFLAGLGRKEVGSWVADGGYDVVVATYPPSSQCLGSLRQRGECPVPVLTYVTDPAVHRAWVHRGADAHLTVTRASANQGSADHGIAMIAAGPLVGERFATVTADRRDALRTQLGLPPGGPVALLSAGSEGLGDVQRTAAELSAAGFVPLVLCGRNARLLRKLAGVPGAVPLGWRTDVDELMCVADVMVHNAGGLTFTEALVCGLPAVTYRPIPGHGRANAEALERGGLAPWARTREQLAKFLRMQVAAGAPAAPSGDPTDVVLAVLAGRVSA
jgi:processive 1,2-diacylglycerol beta-glucosyltransferase